MLKINFLFKFIFLCEMCSTTYSSSIIYREEIKADLTYRPLVNFFLN